MQHCISVPFLHTQRSNGSHSVAFGDVAPQFGLSKDFKCAVPCTGEAHWQVRFDRTSTKLSILFPLSVLGLDTKPTTLLGTETWYLPCSSELPKCATLCHNSKSRAYSLSLNAHLKSHSRIRLLILPSGMLWCIYSPEYITVNTALFTLICHKSNTVLLNVLQECSSSQYQLYLQIN